MAASPGSEVDLTPRAQILVNDEDLLSRSTQRAVEDMASVLGVILVVAMFMANLVAPQRRSRVMADFVVGFLGRGQSRPGHPITDAPPVPRTTVTAEDCGSWLSDEASGSTSDSKVA